MATIFPAEPQSQAVIDPQDAAYLREILRILRRRWRVIAAVVLATTFLAIAVVYQIQPRYSATARVAIENRKTQVTNIQDVMSGMTPDTATMETQAGILTSSTLAAKLVRRLALDQDPEFNPRARVRNREFSFMDPSTWSDLGNDDTKQVETTSLDAMRERAAVVTTVLAALKVKVSPASYIIDITATTEDPTKSARIANTLADLYITDQIEAKYEATRRAASWLEGRVDQLRGEVVASERAVEIYKVQNGLVAGTSGGVDSQQLSEVNSQLILARSDRAAKEARLGQIRQLLAGGGTDGLETSAAIVDAPLIQRLKEQESEVARKLAEFGATYGDRHPKIVNAQAELRDIRGKISGEVRKVAASAANEVSVARAREQAFVSSLSALRGSVGRTGEAEVRLRALEREAESNKALFEVFLNRFKETSQQTGVQSADARLISEADIPLSASYPRKSASIGLTAFISIVVGVGLALSLEKLDDTIRTAEQVERLGGRSVLAMIPVVDGRKSAPEDIVIGRPHSIASESLRTLRGALALSDVDHPPRMVMITSSVPAEGKTFVSATLARTAALSGLRVLVVDADLRQPRVHKALGLENGAGLVQVLSGASRFEDALQKDPKGSTEVLTAGYGAPNPDDLLRSRQFEQLLANIRASYDMVIIDTPPLMAVIDGQIIASTVDKVVLVVRWGSTPKAVVLNTVRQLTKLGAPLAGAVLSQVNMARQALYGAGESGYFYSKYGAYYGGEE